MGCSRTSGTAVGDCFGRGGGREAPVVELAAGLGVAVGGRALHVGRPLNGALVERRIHGGHGGLALAAAAHGGRGVEGNGLGLGRGGQQQAGK